MKGEEKAPNPMKYQIRGPRCQVYDLIRISLNVLNGLNILMVKMWNSYLSPATLNVWSKNQQRVDELLNSRLERLKRISLQERRRVTTMAPRVEVAEEE